MIIAWSIFNLLLVLLFLYACWRVGRFLKSHVGTATTIPFMLGHSWSAQDGILNVKDNAFQYDVSVKHDWSVLGTQVYTSMENYTGQMPIKDENTLH
ncbi:hypothetical protein HMJ29_04175 [Hymenobacter taeanensis]|uniref:Uncharacterized protein n=1 Tax=Hymenobacter taeanensis TaxID=2735321 RepID=A0A6M6BGM2_9BACT|nr:MULTISPECIES: hypothetical protein [Hymenobacter]QJX46175.1 hypothetical protein HMJ29_04175 [Hymenobacter taeanensis]UOQ80031.1 hypothetical protein MUN83_14440 [Hymenobacter sp. 5414T-23]